MKETERLSAGNRTADFPRRVRCCNNSLPRHGAFNLSASFYKNSWKVELFFKWLKQHIKKFWGTTENDVRIQLGAAISAYCLVLIVQKTMETKRSTYELLQILNNHFSIVSSSSLCNVPTSRRRKASFSTVSLCS